MRLKVISSQASAKRPYAVKSRGQIKWLEHWKKSFRKKAQVRLKSSIRIKVPFPSKDKVRWWYLARLFLFLTSRLFPKCFIGLIWSTYQPCQEGKVFFSSDNTRLESRLAFLWVPTMCWLHSNFHNYYVKYIVSYLLYKWTNARRYQVAWKLKLLSM